MTQKNMTEILLDNTERRFQQLKMTAVDQPEELLKALTELDLIHERLRNLGCNTLTSVVVFGRHNIGSEKRPRYKKTHYQEVIKTLARKGVAPRPTSHTYYALVKEIKEAWREFGLEESEAPHCRYCNRYGCRGNCPDSYCDECEEKITKCICPCPICHESGCTDDNHCGFCEALYEECECDNCDVCGREGEACECDPCKLCGEKGNACQCSEAALDRLADRLDDDEELDDYAAGLCASCGSEDCEGECVDEGPIRDDNFDDDYDDEDEDFEDEDDEEDD